MNNMGATPITLTNFLPMKLIKEIKSKDGILHFRRWAILQTKYFSIYKHGIYHEDLDKHLHNHPWNLLTIIIKGSYIEELENAKFIIRDFLHIGFRNRKNYHKINRLLTKEVYSIAFAFGKRDDNWGYKVGDKHVIHTDYRKNKNESQL